MAKKEIWVYTEMTNGEPAAVYYELLAKADQLEALKGLNGSMEIYACCDTLQVKDYSKYNMASFNEEHKKKMREEQFPHDLEEAFSMGARLGRASR